MRKTFANLLHQRMAVDDRVFLLTADLGYGILDQIREDFPKRFVNVGAAEQLLIGAAVGLTYEGFIPVCYSITPFLLGRPFEMIRNYVDHEGAPVKLVGCGRGKEYECDGFTHWSEDASAILQLFPSILRITPRGKEELESCLGVYLNHPGPAFLSLSRFGG